MYGRQGNANNTQPPPWLVRAEVTIRHGTPATSESEQVPVGMSSTLTDSGGLRMVYRWNTNQLPQTTDTTTASVPSTATTTMANSGSFGFQRGNILFTSTPPPRPSEGSYTIPRPASSGNDDSTSSRGHGANVSDSGYNSEQFSPHCYSSLPTRRPSQQYNRRCRSTCSIVLSSSGTIEGTKQDSQDEATSQTPAAFYDNSWRHHPAHQHMFSRYQFSTVPEVCEDCAEGATSSAFTTHFCTRLSEKVGNKVSSKTQTTSKDAASQTTDVESRGSSSTISRGNKLRRKPTPGPQYRLDEQKKKKQEDKSPNASFGTTSSGLPTESEKSDSSAKDDSTKRKSRTVHIDVYCTGSDDEGSTCSSTENDCETPATVFENPDVKVIHTQKDNNVLPRGFQDEKAFLKRASERRCDSFKNAPMRLPSLASSKGYESDDVLSSLYPSQFSSYSAIRDLDSNPWTPASSNSAFPFDYDSTIATSAKDTFSDIESLINSRTGLSSCDSFEYANTVDRDRIRKMEEQWSKVETEEGKTWRSPQIERKYLLQNKRMKEYLERHEMGWSSEESDQESDESGTVGWSFVSSDDNQRGLKKNSTIRRTSKDRAASTEKTGISATEFEDGKKNIPEDQSDSTTQSESIFRPLIPRDQIGSFGSKSPSPLPSKIPSRVTSPFTTPQGERTDHILKASIFGQVINAFRKPGHHIGPAKNPSCSCEHCTRYYEELAARSRSRSISEVERLAGFRVRNEKNIMQRDPMSSGH